MRDWSGVDFVVGGIFGFAVAIMMGAVMGASEKRAVREALACEAEVVRSWECP